jgi:hypothetical protein
MNLPTEKQFSEIAFDEDLTENFVKKPETAYSEATEDIPTPKAPPKTKEQLDAEFKLYLE